MKLSMLAAFTLAAITTAMPATTTKYDLSAQVVQAVYTVGNDTAVLNTTLNGFEPDSLLGIFTSLKIQEQTQTINSALTRAAGLVNKSASWNDTSSLNVAITFLDLEPVIFSVLDNIVRKKPAFATAIFDVGDLSQTVEGDLITQKDLSRELGDAVQSKLSSALAGEAPAINKQIEEHFDKVIMAYKECTGLICLPSLSGL